MEKDEEDRREQQQRDVEMTDAPVENASDGLNSSDVEAALRLFEYLLNHPDQKDTRDISKLRFLVKQWLNPGWKAEKKKEQRVEQVAADKAALDKAGLRLERKRKMQAQHAQQHWKKELTEQPHKRLKFHPEDTPGTRAHALEGEDAAPLPPAPTIADEPATANGEPIAISSALVCYVCKKDVRVVHSFYDQMCPACGTLNYAKRVQSADLAGKVALVTGGRIKIGYEIVLKLLRAGAAVIVTTRFPKDCTLRLAAEPDFASWQSRVHVYALDLRLLPALEAFCAHVLDAYPRLDILINNAAQTIRRPPVFYENILRVEQAPLHPALQPLLGAFTPTAALPSPSSSSSSSSASSLVVPAFSELAALSATPAQLSQVRLLPEDSLTPEQREQQFPVGAYDRDGQQVDLRTHNSWVKESADVSTVELAEVHVVNALAPFVLAAKLKPLMARARTPAFIVNVSSMEGKFSRTKKTTHPHTNMAKASMNMMTRTCAEEYARDGIYMTSVDTGWITYENPLEFTAQKQELGLEPPIDEIDGAARVLDPVFSGVRDNNLQWGVFYKDYLPSKW